MNVFAVMIQGWGDREESFENCGLFYTKTAAEAALEKMLGEWEDNGGDRSDVVWYIEDIAMKG